MTARPDERPRSQRTRRDREGSTCDGQQPSLWRSNRRTPRTHMPLTEGGCRSRSWPHPASEPSKATTRNAVVGEIRRVVAWHTPVIRTAKSRDSADQSTDRGTSHPGEVKRLHDVPPPRPATGDVNRTAPSGEHPPARRPGAHGKPEPPHRIALASGRSVDPTWSPRMGAVRHCSHASPEPTIRQQASARRARAVHPGGGHVAHAAWVVPGGSRAPHDPDLVTQPAHCQCVCADGHEPFVAAG